MWEHEPVEWVFTRNFEFSQTSTSVSIMYGNMGIFFFYFFYKITRRKLKRRNSLRYRSVNSPYCLWWCMPWRIIAWTFPCFPCSYRNTAFSQSKLTFSKCHFINCTRNVYAPLESLACLFCILGSRFLKWYFHIDLYSILLNFIKKDKSSEQ